MSNYNNQNDYSLEKLSPTMRISSPSIINGISREYGEQIVNNYLQQREGFLQRITSDPKTREMIMGELQLVKTEYEFRQKSLAMVKATQLQALQETCNQYLVQGKVFSRADTTKFMMSKAEELLAEIDRVYDKFIVAVEEKTLKIETLKNQKLRQAIEEQLNREIERFTELREQLLQKFQNIVSEGV